MINMSNESSHHHRIGHGLFAIGAFFILLFATLVMPYNTAVSKAFGASDIIDLSNKSRVQFGENALNTNSTLMSAAQAKAEHMVKNRYFAHYGPDGSAPWDYFSNAGYKYIEAGENLAITNETAEAVVNGWLNSPTHRENLLNKNFSDMGIGMAYYGEYQGNKNTYVVVAFYGKMSPSLVVTGAEPTSPAGTIAAFKPKVLDVNPLIFITAGLSLLIAGILLEYRHLRHARPSRNLPVLHGRQIHAGACRGVRCALCP